MNASPATTTPPAEQVIQGQPVAQQQVSHGSMGTVVGVVAAIAVLGIIAGVIGRLCGRRSIMGYGGRFDIEEWAERKCSSCIDGHVSPPPPRTEETGGRGNASAMNTGEVKTQEEEEEEGERESSNQEEEEGEHGYDQNHQQRHSHVDAL